MTQPLEQVIEGMGTSPIVVVGDVMLDEYLWGDANRVSPEAPVPVVQLRRRTYSLGGAANAAVNAAAFGAPVRLVGVVGSDQQGATLRSLLPEQQIRDDLVTLESGSTTTKTRIMAGHQQVARVDEEKVAPLPDDTALRLIDVVERALPGSSGILISDYAKGVLHPPIVARLISLARTAGLPVVVDPKGVNFARYLGATVVTPNLSEAIGALGYQPGGTPDVERIGHELLEALEGTPVLITRGSDGMSLFRAAEPVHHVQPAPVKVSDVTGAGDTVAATLILALVAGAQLEEAARLANLAGGQVVQKVGTATVSREELRVSLRG